MSKESGTANTRDWLEVSKDTTILAYTSVEVSTEVYSSQETPKAENRRVTPGIRDTEK